MDYPLPGSVYKHYKGGIYKVLSLATHTETSDPLVIYQSIHFGSIYARPLSMWEDLCECDGWKLKRF